MLLPHCVRPSFSCILFSSGDSLIWTQKSGCTSVPSLRLNLSKSLMMISGKEVTLASAPFEAFEVSLKQTSLFFVLAVCWPVAEPTPPVELRHIWTSSGKDFYFWRRKTLTDELAGEKKKDSEKKKRWKEKSDTSDTLRSPFLSLSLTSLTGIPRRAHPSIPPSPGGQITTVFFGCSRTPAASNSSRRVLSLSTPCVRSSCLRLNERRLSGTISFSFVQKCPVLLSHNQID